MWKTQKLQKGSFHLWIILGTIQCIILRLVRSSIINHLPPLSPSFDRSLSHDYFCQHANSTSSYHEGNFSSFRSRNLSNASSTGPMSPLHLDDLAQHNFPLLTDNIKTESELDNITLDDLNMESEPLFLDPANTLLEFLHPEKRQLHDMNSVSHKIKVKSSNWSTTAWVWNFFHLWR